MKKKKAAAAIILAVLFCAAVLLSCSPESKKTALKVIIISNMSPTGHFYVNKDNGVGMLVTGSGKTAAALSLMATLSSDLYDYSDAYIVSVGCGGGSAEYCMLGDVILVTSVCDYDLGRHVDAHERGKSSTRIMWFPDNSFSDYEFKLLNPVLCEKVYGMLQGCPHTCDESGTDPV